MSVFLISWHILFELFGTDLPRDPKVDLEELCEVMGQATVKDDLAGYYAPNSLQRSTPDNLPSYTR